MVYKRRACMALDAAECFLQAPAPGTQIERELAYALTLYPALAPRVALCYDREAFYAMDDPELRMTFDSDIRWRAEALDLRAGTDGTPILTPGQVLLEVKTATAVPLWLCRLLSGAGIRQTSFSKYGRAYQTIAGQIPTYVLHKGEQRYA